MIEPNGVAAKIADLARRADESDQARTRIWDRLTSLGEWKGETSGEIRHIGVTLTELDKDIGQLRESLDRRIRSAYVLAISSFTLALAIAGAVAATVT